MSDDLFGTRLDTLPLPKPRWNTLLTSTALQGVLTAILVLVPTLSPHKPLSSSAYQAVSIVVPYVKVALPSKHPVLHRKSIPRLPPLEQPLQPQSVAKLILPRPLAPVEPRTTSVPTVDMSILNEVPAELRFAATTPEPVRPPEPVKTGTLAAASASLPNAGKSHDQIQTGGISDSNGPPADNNPNNPRSVIHSGAFPPAPGYGNGTALSAVRRPAVRAGFGDSVGTSPVSAAGGTAGMIRSGGFEKAVLDSGVSRPKQDPPGVQPVVILEKPNPLYSDEARRLGIEGDVLIEVVFPASGPVQVVRVTHGLGHGLDEAAIRAAKQIRFKPALENGKPVDFPASVHIEFLLAF